MCRRLDNADQSEFFSNSLSFSFRFFTHTLHDMLAESSLSGRLWAIATYEGSRLDTFLNWTMLYLTLLAFAERARCTMPKRRSVESQGHGSPC